MGKTKRSRAPVSPRSADDPVTYYAEEVTAGSIIAGPHVRDTCARHLRDLKDGPTRGLFWDLHETHETFRFYREVLRLNGGEFEGKPFELDISQQFIVGSLFGWKSASGFRRFKIAFIEQGKGNGKSPLVAGIGLKMLAADQEPRAEVYAAATKKDQAQILFRDAVAMVDLSPDLDEALERSGGKGKEWNIADLATGSFFRTIASDDAQSGPRPHCALLDEVHEHKSGLMVDMMVAGTKGRRQPLIVMITNSGTDKESVCWANHEYAVKVCAGTLIDDGFFGYVCALDQGDDPLVDRSCWIKANPLLGVSFQPEYLEGQTRLARGMPSMESRVRRLNFCQWVESSNPWLSSDVWFAARDADYDEALLVGRRCFGGLDLSSTTALTAFVLLFEPTENDPHWRQKCWFWIPQDSLISKDPTANGKFAEWHAAGWLTTTLGGAVNKLKVMTTLVAAAERYNIVSIGYDRWRIEDFKSQMADEGVTLPLESYGQGFKDMAPAVDEYERMLISGELRHDGNPVMNYCVGSAVIESDSAGNRKLTKSRSNGLIDGAVAGVMAAGRSITPAEPEKKYQLLVV